MCFDCSYCCVLVDDLLRWKEILMCFFFCVEGALLLLWLLLLEFPLCFELWLQCFFVVLCWKKSHSSMEVAIAYALKVLLLLRVFGSKDYLLRFHQGRHVLLQYLCFLFSSKLSDTTCWKLTHKAKVPVLRHKCQ